MYTGAEDRRPAAGSDSPAVLLMITCCALLPPGRDDGRDG